MTDVVNAKTELTPGEGAKAPSPGKARLRRGAIIASFLLPALIVLGALVVYPIVFTIVRSFYDQGGENFAGWDNYVTMFTNDTTFTAIRNNIMWVIIAPASCTILGLIFAVLLEKLKWKTAFKLIIFMPMAISMLAAGVIFRGMFQENPNLGVVNAFIVGVNNIFSDSADYPGAKPRDGFGIIEDRGVIATEGTVSPGTTHDFPLTGIRATNLPAEAEQAVAAPTASDTQVTGLLSQPCGYRPSVQSLRKFNASAGR